MVQSALPSRLLALLASELDQPPLGKLIDLFSDLIGVAIFTQAHARHEVVAPKKTCRQQRASWLECAAQLPSVHQLSTLHDSLLLLDARKRQNWKDYLGDPDESRLLPIGGHIEMVRNIYMASASEAISFSSCIGQKSQSAQMLRLTSRMES